MSLGIHMVKVYLGQFDIKGTPKNLNYSQTNKSVRFGMSQLKESLIFH